MGESLPTTLLPSCHSEMASIGPTTAGDSSALYETIVYNSLADSVHKISAELARWLMRRSFLTPEAPLRLLDLGAWAGWHSIFLYRELHSAFQRTQDSIHLVDKADSLACYQLWNTVCPNEDIRRCCYFQADVSDYLDENPDEIEGTSIIFLCFLVHHLGSNWRSFLRKLTHIVQEGTIIILSELRGDHAGWCLSFDKLPNLPLGASARQRRTFLRVLKTVSEATERSGWFYYKNPNASRTEAAIVELESLGWVLETELPDSPRAEISVEYDASFKLEDLISSSQFFSAFPTDLTSRKRVLEEIETLGFAKDLELVSRNCLVYRVLRKARQT